MLVRAIVQLNQFASLGAFIPHAFLSVQSAVKSFSVLDDCVLKYGELIDILKVSRNGSLAGWTTWRKREEDSIQKEICYIKSGVRRRLKLKR
ncbi:unnamed protein product [Calypogeia fissa]